MEKAPISNPGGAVETERPAGASPFDAPLPREIAQRAESVGAEKLGRLDLAMLLPLAVLGGAFIALGANLSTVVATNSALGWGPTRLLMGAAFSLGLGLVVVAGAELFTGNNLIVMACVARRGSIARLLAHWGIVYAGNLVGAVATAVAVYWSGQWRLDDAALGVTMQRIALQKVELPWASAFWLGVLANALVCLAVWVAMAARSLTDKLLAVLLPVAAFVAGGFEHSIANAYLVPLGILVDGAPDLAGAVGAAPAGSLNLADFLPSLVPVTLGNIVGGAGMVGLVYSFIYYRPRK